MTADNRLRASAGVGLKCRPIKCRLADLQTGADNSPAFFRNSGVPSQFFNRTIIILNLNIIVKYIVS